MRRFLKAASFLAGLALLLAVGGAAVLKILLPPEKARQMIVDSAGKALNREVRLKGLSIGLLRGVLAHGVEVSQEPDFKAGVFAQAEAFRLRVSWAPLLRKQVVVDSVALEGLTLNLTRGKDGALRLPGGGGGSAFRLAVRKASIKDGAVFFRDEASGAQWRLSGLSAQFSDFSLERPFQVEAAFEAEGKAGSRPIKAAVAFSGSVDPAGGQPEKASVVIRKLSVAESGMTLKASGKAAAGPKPKAELKLALEAAGAEILVSDVRAESNPEAGSARAEFSARTPGVEPRILELLGVPAGVFLPAATASGRLDLTGDDLNIPEAVVETRAGGARIKARLKNLKQARPEIEAQAKLKLSLPAFKSGDLPWMNLPAGLAFPALRLEGGVRLRGQDAFLEELVIESPQGRVALDGVLRDALARRPRPEMKAALKLDLPAFASSDVPFAALPAGLALPASHLEGSITIAEEEARLKALRLKAGGTDLEVEGSLKGLSSKLSAELLLKCRSFVLEELTRISPATRELGLSGRGFFALSVKGPIERPFLGGKLQFQGLGATVGGLKLSEFSGLAKFDERRIDIPNLKGTLADAALSMDLTVKDYVKAADIDLVAELAKLDLGAFFAAKAALAKNKAEPDAAKRPPLRAKGRLTIAKLVHPNASAQDAKLSWELDGITPDLKSLDGWAKLSIGAGSFNDLGLMAAQSPVMKVLVLPIALLQKIGGIGGLRLFPDLNNIAFSEIGGEYAFKKGLMQIRDSHLFSEALHATTTGSIDLPSEKLDLVVTAQVGRVAPIDIGVTGSFSKPVAKPKVAKFLADPAKQLLQNILKLP